MLHHLSARVCVQDLGGQTIHVDDVEVAPKLVKSVEMLAFLAIQGGRASRAEIVKTLFEGSSVESASAYFRMALSGLRKVLPNDAPLVVDGDLVQWTGDTLTATSVQIENEARTISRLPLADQVPAIDRVLRTLEEGPFIPGSRAEWVLTRRSHLDLLMIDLREMASEVAYRTGRYVEADAWGRRVVSDDPLRERSWRLLMRVASALGDTDRVTAAFRDCSMALREIDAQPEEATAALFRHLRAEVRPH